MLQVLTKLYEYVLRLLKYLSIVIRYLLKKKTSNVNIMFYMFPLLSLMTSKYGD